MQNQVVDIFQESKEKTKSMSQLDLLTTPNNIQQNYKYYTLLMIELLRILFKKINVILILTSTMRIIRP